VEEELAFREGAEALLDIRTITKANIRDILRRNQRAIAMAETLSFE